MKGVLSHFTVMSYREGGRAMEIALGSDRERIESKQRLKLFLIETGHVVEDFGVEDGEATPLPAVVRSMAEAVALGDLQRGIVLGETGSGEAMVANRLPGVRCAVCWNAKSARKTRQHLNANVLALGLGVISFERARTIVEVWLETPFQRRQYAGAIQQLDGRTVEHHRSNGNLPHRTPLLEQTNYVCDTCGQEFSIPIDLSAGSSQDYVEECPVCCHAHEIHVSIDDNGTVLVAGSKD
jgi:ribose 5-phosphate isomerase B